MRSWFLKAGSTGVGGLELRERNLPEPGPGQVRVRVGAASLNYRDQLVAKAAFGPITRDLVPVADGAGTIDAIGSDVTKWRKGDRVVDLYFRNWVSGPPHAQIGRGLGAGDEDGMLAEYVLLDQHRLAAAPPGFTVEQASTLPCAGVTAWNALFGDHAIWSESTILTVGTGGVSLFAIQIAKAIGATVHALTGQADRSEALRALGVDQIFNYKMTPQWGALVFEKTGGVDKVVDAAGNVNQSLAALKPGGEVAALGLMSNDGPLDPLTLMGKSLTVRGIAVGSEEQHLAFTEFVEVNRIQPTIAATFAFKDAKQAYEAQAASPFGKVVITISGDW